MKIALFESQILWEKKKRNIEVFREHIDILMKSEELDLICLPEMSFTGFSMNVSTTCDMHNETLKKMEEISNLYGISIAFGWVEHRDNKYYNHYSVVSDKKRMDYIKIHPFSMGGEKDFFTAGNQIIIGKIETFKIGFQICYDLRFPELFQILSKKADMIIVPANWPDSRVGHWDTLLRARAIENQVYIVGINCMGVMNGVKYPGHSCIYNPNGNICKHKNIEFENKDKVYIYSIFNDVQQIRDSLPIKNDRREDLYHKFLERGI